MPAARVARLLAQLAAAGERECLFWRGHRTSCAELVALEHFWSERLDARGIGAGRVVAIQSDYSPDAIALLLALLERGAVAALLPRSAGAGRTLLADACAQGVFRSGTDGALTFEACDAPAARHPLLDQLAASGEAGIVLFSSATTGRAKAILHSAERFLSKFDAQGKGLRTLAFLLFDHVAGLDTLFYTLVNGGALVLPDSRDRGHVCDLVEHWKVEVLPVSPTFLKLVCLTHAWEGHDFSSLRTITYGSERMDATTLEQVARAFPTAEIVQKYGTSEGGSPRSRSRGRDSLWLSLHPDQTPSQVRDGVLWIKSPSLMLGYLNAPSPFDAEGWYCTGDLVEVDGEWIRILGRGSEVINVGGEKVIPEEVEEVILELPFVEDVLVRGAPHPVTGQIVEALVRVTAPGEAKDLRKRIRAHCLARLPRHEVPVMVRQSETPLTGERQKKQRAQG
jgi:acyl-CoA synthetase (AMP-forming)/AMP-acid ligase II